MLGVCIFVLSSVNTTNHECHGRIETSNLHNFSRRLQVPNPTNFTLNDWIAEEDLGQIINGIKLSPRQYPFLVSVQWKAGNIFRWACGGALLASQWILTAAHCLDQLSPQRLVFGGHNLVDEQEGRDSCPESQMLNKEDIFIHPEWSRSTAENDIALLKVQTPVNYKPITILDQYELKYQTRVMGWGKNENGKSTRIPYYAQVNLMNIDACTERYRDSYVISNKQVCVEGGGSGSCQGDSGGPLIYAGEDAYLLGSVSFSVSCSVNPTVFARTAAYIDWICRTTGGTVCCTDKRCVEYEKKAESPPASRSPSTLTSSPPGLQSGNVGGASPPSSPPESSEMPVWLIFVMGISCLLAVICFLLAIRMCCTIETVWVTE